MDSVQKTVFSFFVGVFLLQIVGGTLSSETKTQIKEGMSNFKLVLDGLADVTSDKKLISNIQHLSGFLGVAGGFISFLLLFVPQEESAELLYMKEQFAAVNMKLDRMFSELDDIKDLITLETQRAVYIGDASNILLAYKQLTEHYIRDMLAVTSCTSYQDCLRQRLRVAESYQNTFNVKSSLHKILRGTAEPTSYFGEPLLDLLKKAYKCDIGKVLKFAEGVIKLAFQGQEVVLVYEKLTGSNTSIIHAVKDWAKLVYALRNKVENIKSDCYSNMDNYIKEDVEDTKYQTNMASNREGADTMKANLDRKYPWLFWSVLSYGVDGGDNHWGFSEFLNMPDSKENRKRVIRVVAQDKGVYTNHRHELSTAIDGIVKDIIFPSHYAAKDIFDRLKSELEQRSLWNQLSAFVVLLHYTDLQIAVDSQHESHYYYNNELTLRIWRLQYGPYTIRSETSIKVWVWASLKSQEEIAGLSCTKTCNGKGTCNLQPHSSSAYCRCQTYFGGIDCQKYDDISLASNIDKMLSVTAQIPKLTDVYYELLDMQDRLGVTLGHIQDTVFALDAKLLDKFDDLNRLLSESKLITIYSCDISDLIYYIQRFKGLNSSDPLFLQESNELATVVLHSDKIHKWTLDLNYLIVGRSDISILAHKPFLFFLMDKYKHLACSEKYKDAMDSAWRQLVVLQNQAYTMWAQAKELLKQSSDSVASEYSSKITSQTSYIKSLTCDIKIEQSANLNCSGGFYLHRNLIVQNDCKANHYLVGNSFVSCESESTSCVACNCNPSGSSDAECQDQSGQCACKDQYYGKQCRDRNCVWSDFGSFESCSMTCGYGGNRTRSRAHLVTQQGQGTQCTGNAYDYTECFNGCCSGEFHCTGYKKCIPGTQRCDYDNNCGNSEDEQSCHESCRTEYTFWNIDGGGDPVFLDRHTINCGGANNVLKMFELEKDDGYIRYRYICCSLFKSVCVPRHVSNEFTYDGNGDTVYLDRQHVNCGSTGVLNEVKLVRNYDHDKWRYEYYCCDLKGSYQSRLSCYDYSTDFTYDGNGYSYYLTTQTVSCNDRYFMQYFNLNRNSNHDYIRYTIRCCTITTFK